MDMSWDEVAVEFGLSWYELLAACVISNHFFIRWWEIILLYSNSCDYVIIALIHNTISWLAGIDIEVLYNRAYAEFSGVPLNLPGFTGR